MKKHFLLLWLVLCCSIGLASAQGRQVQGVVKSAEGEALPGVTVLVKGTTNGASTGIDGGFSVTVAEGSNPTLVFSYIGFATKEVAVGSQANINVALESDSKQLDDVVVIGYQEVQRRDVTGSVSSVNAQQIKDIPVNSAAEALAGRLAGVQVTASEGVPGGDVLIRVRGGGSITQDNSPLYVVDGVQVENALSVVSPQDIASVDVLKDAAATAIYGARGANGVVIITTKNGREGKTTVTYSGFAGFRRISNTLDVMTPADYLDYTYERSALAGSASLDTYEKRFGTRIFTSDTLAQLRKAPFIDWQDKVFGRDAFMQTHNISVAGGGKGTTYALSATRNEEDGVQLESGFVRNLLSFRFDHKASDKFRLGFNARFNDQVISGPGTSSTGSSTTSRLRNAVTYLPLAPNLPGSINPEDLIFDDEFFASSNQLTNPELAIKSEYRRDRRRLYNLSGYASYSIVKNLTLRSTVGFDNTNSTLETFFGQNSPSIRNSTYAGTPYAAINSGLLTTFNNSNVLSYSYKKGKHSVDAVLGHEIYEQRRQELSIETRYLPLDIEAEKAINNINQGNPALGTQPPPQTGRSIDSRLLSGFGRLNYSFDDKYLLTATFRADGSSKFARENRWGYFPAVSAAWRISREEFMKSLTVISDLKLRVSTGLAGNNRIADFLYTSTYQPGNAPYALGNNVVTGAAPTSLANPNLKWETTQSNNVGVDVSVFNNRVQFSADVYYNKTTDLLVNLAIPSTSGYSTQLVNVGATSNRGLELQTTATVVKTPDFSWTASANMSFNRGKVESLGELNELPLQYSGWASTAISADYAVRVGQPVGLMYGYVTDGFYTTADFEGYDAVANRWILKTGVADDGGVIGAGSNGVGPGMLKLKSLDGNSTVTEADRTVIGNANPKFTGGLNQQFTFKNFDASVFLNFVYGNDVYNANKIEFTTDLANSHLSNGLDIMNGRYRLTNASGAVVTNAAELDAMNQNATIWTPPHQLLVHSWAIEDGSFLRVNNITLGYTLPQSLSQRAKIQQLRFYVTLNNIATLTGYSGYDPEVNTRRGTSTQPQPLTPGVDYAAYPRSKAFLFGVNLSL